MGKSIRHLKLRDINREVFAQNMVKYKGNKVRAMMATNPELGYGTAAAHGCRLMTKPEVRERVIELMNGHPDLTLPGLLGGLAKLTKTDNEAIRLRAIEDGLDLHDAKPSPINSDGGPTGGNIHINFEIAGERLEIKSARIDGQA